MSEEPDLVRLLYRADWTRLSLTAEVSVSQDPSRDPGWLLGGVPPAPPPGTWPWSWPPGGSWNALLRVAQEIGRREAAGLMALLPGRDCR